MEDGVEGVAWRAGLRTGDFLIEVRLGLPRAPVGAGLQAREASLDPHPGPGHRR